LRTEYSNAQLLVFLASYITTRTSFVATSFTLASLQQQHITHEARLRIVGRTCQDNNFPELPPAISLPNLLLRLTGKGT